MSVNSSCSTGLGLTPGPQLLTTRTAAVHFLLRRNSGDFCVFHKKRRRLKRLSRSLVLVNSSFFPPPFDGSVSLDSLATTVLGLSSGLAAYLSSRFLGKSMSKSGDRRKEEGVVGEWVLFTSPTPFNRFVLLRCSLLSFDVSGGDGELLESVNDRLLKEERHFVRLDTGKILAAEGDGDSAEDTALEYQRFCVSTEDGGVISLDWPATLDLREERGLDTTVILVPGTPEGSMDHVVRSFVREALRRGVFPVVMNPRGCAGSPLTTARLFTAADSDDISSAVQFITKARPWTTLMGVGWGYGANMLTKYLAEDGERTPLTAAVCIDNPFDLEEITRTSPYHNTLDERLTGGLVHILRSNKELFQGRSKGFDVGKALSSKSVRDFEKAISMVTYGFESIEDFYSISGTASVVGRVKIPILFIQNDDVVPVFSIPRGLIAENPCTSLLLCSLSPSSVIARGSTSLPWCQNLTLEWLTAVELGLLKGRHPLLKDIDVTVNPSKGLAFVEPTASGRVGGAQKLLEVTQQEKINGSLAGAITEMLKDSDFTSRVDLEKNNTTNNGPHEPENCGISESGSVEAELDKDEESSGEGSERGQILQTAEVVMNMLDVTMPGTLKAEEKKKVLAAVDQGETIINALQDAVPEDVRERLTTAVNAILHSPGKLNFEKLKLPNVSQGFKSKTPEPSKGPSSAAGKKDPHFPDQIKKSDDLVNGSDKSPSSLDDSVGGAGPEHFPSDETSHKTGDSGQSQLVIGHQDSSPGLAKKRSDESGISRENSESSAKEKANSADAEEKASEPGGKASSTSQGKPSGSEDTVLDENEGDQDAVIAPQEKKEENIHKNEEKAAESASDQNTVASTNKEETVGPSPGYPSELQLLENDHQKKETKDPLPGPDQTKPSQSGFSVSRAFDALADIDDSTQVAVNSVFGVLENMISQLEEENKEENEISDDKKAKNEESKSPSGEQTPKKKEDEDNMSSDSSWDLVCNLHDRKDSDHGATSGLVNEEHLIGKNVLVGNYDRHLPKLLSERCTNTHENPPHVGNSKVDLSHEQNAKQLDLDMTTALLLDYYPEEGQWKLIERPSENSEESVDEADSRVNSYAPTTGGNEENLIEPSYVTLDYVQDLEVTEKYDAVNNQHDDLNKVDEGSQELMHLVEVSILDSLKVEVKRRMSSSGLRQMESRLSQDIEKVADTVSSAVGDAEHSWLFKNMKRNTTASEKVGRLDGETIIRAISSAVWEARYLRQVLPVGVVVGSSLAALRKYFDVSTLRDDGDNDAQRQIFASEAHKYGKEDQKKSGVANNINQKSRLNSSRIKKGVQAGLQNIKNDSVMVGAVTAALGASAVLAQQQDAQQGTQDGSIMLKSSKEKGSQDKGSDKLDEVMSGKNQSNVVASFTEKAMSVAGPVVPTKEDGEVDQERLVAMLADLGQKGGVLKLVGKFALLWGGIRGAMSLTEKLISFLHVGEWPLLKRVVGFVGMVLVLWSPVVVPLLPTIVQSWSTSNPSKMAELTCIIGLYVAVFILAMLWGKRVRKYKNPFKQYGLDFDTSPKEKFQDFLKGLAGGITLVLLIQSVNAIIGAAIFSWPPNLPSSFDVMKWLKGYGQLLLLTVKGFIAATGVVLVEELLFRSWLPEEIATDLSYHQSIIISGLAFALLQRSLRAIPGSWLLSLALAGARQRTQGDLSVPIGFRIGIMTSSFILQAGRFLTYNPSFPVWVAGTHPLQPFSGVVGLSFCLVLALVLYPKLSPETQKQKQSWEEANNTEQ